MSKGQLLAELKNWSAPSGQDFSTAETKQELRFSRPPSLGCVVCSREIKCTPVYQCQTGHLACARCSQGGNSCPSCAKAISRIKNVAIGDMIKLMEVSCKFAKLGCKAMLAFTAPRSEHESMCGFEPVNCPMLGCSQAGLKNLLPTHLLRKHRISSVVDIDSVDYSGSYQYNRYTWHIGEFDLDSSSTLVLLKHKPADELYLLHQEGTALGERLQVTSLLESLTKPSKRKYELNVEINNEQTYSFNSVCTSKPEQHGGLLIPRMPDGVPSAKKRCKIRMLQTEEEEEQKIKIRKLHREEFLE